jgi:hypothetical protein
MSAIAIYDIVDSFENPMEIGILLKDSDIYADDNVGFTVSSTDNIMPNKEKQVIDTFQYLKYTNSAVLEIAFDILTALNNQSKDDFIISHTGDNELLIYRNNNGEFRNIIIDNDGDIEYLCIPKIRRNTYNEHYPFVLGINADQLAGKL